MTPAKSAPAWEQYLRKGVAPWHLRHAGVSASCHRPKPVRLTHRKRDGRVI